MAGPAGEQDAEQQADEREHEQHDQGDREGPARGQLDGYQDGLGTDGFGRSENRQHLRAFFEVSAEAIASAALSRLALDGKVAGAYRLIRVLGRGGMGVVYLGQRDDDQFTKQVAVKLVKRGMDTDFVLARFKSERRILAGLEHPHIAQLLDGGSAEDGRCR